jgi:hypothetical protein
MRKLFITLAIASAVAWSGAAWAVLQETTLTINDSNGQPVKNATVSFERNDGKPVTQTDAKTNDKGQIKVSSDKPADKTELSRVKVKTTVTTKDENGKDRKLIVWIPLGKFFDGGAVTAVTQTAATQRPSTPTHAAVTPAAAVAPVQVFDWTGFYWGAGVGYGWGTASVAGITGDAHPSGAFGGLVAGNRWQNGNWVYGYEGSINLAHLHGSVNWGGAIYSGTVNWYGTAVGQVGVLVDPVDLVSLTGGFVFGNYSAKLVDGADAFQKSHVMDGWTVGAKYERSINPGTTFFLSYMYYDLGTKTFVLDEAERVHVRYSTVETGMTWRFSDARLKRDVQLLATLDNGLKIYSFKYLWSDTTFVGVMAQDLLANPTFSHAVAIEPSGFYAVDYRVLGLTMTTLKAWEAEGVTAVRDGGQGRALMAGRSL